MGPSFSLRLGGLRVTVRMATPVILAVVAGGLVTATAREGAPVALEAALLFLVAVGALLIHEAARTAVYLAAGVRVRAVEITIAGGSPALVDHTLTPRREVVAGLAGLFAISLLAAGAVIGDRITEGRPDLHHGAHLTLLALAALAVLQAMPALPLDGGRILRAFVWYLSDDPATGSRGAAIYGQAVSLALVVVGGALLLGERERPYWGLAAITAGLQLAGATASESRDARRQREAGHVELRHAGLPIPRRMAATAPVAAAVDSLIDAGPRAVILVENDDGEPVGIVRLVNLRHARRAEWDQRVLAEIMTPIGDLFTLSPRISLFETLVAFEKTGLTLAIIHAEDGQIFPVTHAELLARLAAREHGDE